MRQVDYKILANESDITALIRDRLIELVINDEAGEESDTATISIDNRDNKVRFPATGATLDIFIGYVGEALVFRGTYEVDELQEPLEESTLTISAKAAKMKSSIKAPRSASYDDVTFGGLVERIAKSHGYDVSVSEAVASYSFAHIDQVNESDMSLLTRLARDVGAIMKPVANKLIAVQRGESKSVSGEPLPSVVIDDPADSTGSVTIQERSAFESVAAKWFDESTQSMKVYKTSDAEPIFEISKQFKDQEAAEIAASAKLKELKRGRSTLSLGRPLVPSAFAEARMIVSNHKSSANGEWLIQSLSHTIAADSYATTSFRCASV